MTPKKVNPVTWAVLSVYAQTIEGQSAPKLAAFVKENAPRGRLKSTALITAQGLGCLDAAGRLTPSGWAAASSALERLNLGSAGGHHESP